MSSSLTQDQITPNAANLGTLGTAEKPWGEIHGRVVYQDGEPVGSGSGSGWLTPGVAGANLGGHRAVRWDGNGLVVYADANSRLAARGIIRDAAGVGEPVTVYTGGVVNGFSGLTPEQEYYLGEDGSLLATPYVNFWQPMGHAISTTELLVDPGLSVRVEAISASD